MERLPPVSDESGGYPGVRTGDLCGLLWKPGAIPGGEGDGQGVPLRDCQAKGHPDGDPEREAECSPPGNAGGSCGGQRRGRDSEPGGAGAGPWETERAGQPHDSDAVLRRPDLPGDRRGHAPACGNREKAPAEELEEASSGPDRPGGTGNSGSLRDGSIPIPV